MRRFAFLKGQATLNDYIIIDDQHSMRDLTPEFVRQLCDRRGGIGADGLLRVVRAQNVPEWEGDPDLWFMDVRSADGSKVETCGNGLRLFARHLMNEQLVPSGRFKVATREGLRNVRIARGGMISIDVSHSRALDGAVEVTLADRSWPGKVYDSDTPQVVVFVEEAELTRLNLATVPEISPKSDLTNEANVVFVAETGPGELLTRVHGSGVGELTSCGSAAVAAAMSWRERDHSAKSVRVQTAGGELLIDFKRKSTWLTGPAVIHLRGEFWS